MKKLKQIISEIDACVPMPRKALSDAVREHIAKLGDAVACLRENSTEDIYHSEGMPMGDYVAVREVDIGRLENLDDPPVDKDQIIADLRAEIVIKDQEIDDLGWAAYDPEEL